MINNFNYKIGLVTTISIIMINIYIAYIIKTNMGLKTTISEVESNIGAVKASRVDYDRRIDTIREENYGEYTHQLLGDDLGTGVDPDKIDTLSEGIVLNYMDNCFMVVNRAVVFSIRFQANITTTTRKEIDIFYPDHIPSFTENSSLSKHVTVAVLATSKPQVMPPYLDIYHIDNTNSFRMSIELPIAVYAVNVTLTWSE